MGTPTYLAPCITQIETRFRDRTIGHATGFFLKYEGLWWLVTNWHVLAGRHPLTGQPLGEGGAVPDACTFYSFTLVEGKAVWTDRHCALGDPLTGTAIWYQHPAEGQSVDVAALCLGENKPGIAKDLLESGGHEPEMWLDSGSEVFIPGYPLGLRGSGRMPIWKRASIASSLDFGEGINRRILVDTATREGMSGAPCLAFAMWRHFRFNSETEKMMVVENPACWRLLGIYSGRIAGGDELEAQLGIVWRENLIFETLRGRTLASVSLA